MSISGQPDDPVLWILKKNLRTFKWGHNQNSVKSFGDEIIQVKKIIIIYGLLGVRPRDNFVQNKLKEPPQRKHISDADEK